MSNAKRSIGFRSAFSTRPLAAAGLAWVGLLPLVFASGAQAEDAEAERIAEDIEFARGLAEDWQFVDLAEQVLNTVPADDLASEQQEQLTLTRAELYRAAALGVSDETRREELFVQALGAYRAFINTYTNSTYTDEAQRNYVDLGSVYGQDMANRLEDAVGEERERMLTQVEEQLSEVSRFAGEQVDSMTGIDLPPAELQEFYRLSLAQGQILLILGEIVEDGDFILDSATEAMEALGYGAGVESGWGLSAFNTMGRIETAKGNPDTAADLHLYVVENLVGANDEDWEAIKEFTDPAFLPRKWTFYEREVAPMLEALQAAGRTDEAMSNGLRFYNMLNVEGFDLSPFGYQSLLAVGGALLNQGGIVGGAAGKGNLTWYPTAEELDAAGVGKRDRQSAIELALELGGKVNQDNKGNILQLRAQNLIADVVSSPGIDVKAETLFEAAQGSYFARDYADAVAGLRRVIPALENEAEAKLIMPKLMYHMGASLRGMDRDLEAAMAFRTAIMEWGGDEEYDPRSADGLYRVMNTMRKDFPEVPEIQALWRDAEDFKQSLGSGGTEDIAWRRANNAMNAGDYDGARGLFAEIGSDSAYFEPAQVRSARSLQLMDDLAGADEELRQYIEDFVNDPNNRLGSQDAVKKQQRAAAVAEGQFFRGQIAYRQEDWQAVIDRLANYSGPDNLGTAAAAYVVEAATNLGDIPGAVRYLDAMAEKYPDAAETGKAAIDLYNGLLETSRGIEEEIAALGEEPEAEALEPLEERLRETKLRMAESLSLANGALPNPSFNLLRNEGVLWYEIEAWEQAVEAFERLNKGYATDGSEKERETLGRFVAPDHSAALLELKRVQEAYDLLAPLMPDPQEEGVRTPTPKAILSFGRAVGGWPEGDPANPTIVPGVGTGEDYSRAVAWGLKLARQYDRFEGEWWPTQAQLGMLYLSWGKIDSTKRDFAKKLLGPIDSNFGPTYRELEEVLGDPVQAGYFKWMWNQAK